MFPENCSSQIKSIWAAPWSNEADAPSKRIIHGRYVKLPSAEHTLKLGVCMGKGYFKCGSEKTVDWIEDLAVYAWRDGDWKKIQYVTGLERPDLDGAPHWIELAPAQAYFLEVRKSGVDGFWPCYNIAQTGFVFEITGPAQEIRRPVRRLHPVNYEPDLELLKKEDISLLKTSVSARYTSPYYSVGFRLKSMGLDFLGLDGKGDGKTHDNLLAVDAISSFNQTDFRTQGAVLNPVADEAVCGLVAYDLQGETNVCGNQITYQTKASRLGIECAVTFTLYRSSISIRFDRKVANTVKLLDSVPFQIAFDSRKIPLTALGKVIQEGETGALKLPLTLHLPGYANIRLEGSDSMGGRFNSIRPEHANTFGFHLGETLCKDGCYRLEKGEYSGTVTLSFGFEHHLTLKPDTPPHVKEAFDRYVLSCLPFRADTASLSNNGNSMGAPICMDLWGALCSGVGDGPNGVKSSDFMRLTIEKYLLGAPAYAAGIHQSSGRLYEDSYLMTGTAALLGIAHYLHHGATAAWFGSFKPYIIQKIDEMKKRDIDDDGLVESLERRGISGEHQWSTSWYDVISYGYKDAFSNALLYPALLLLSKAFVERGDDASARALDEWATR